MKKRIPNALTLVRIFLIPIIFAFSQTGRPLAALALFLFAAVTDFFDGRLARRWSAQSSFGALWDPIADKLVVIFFFGYFAKTDSLPVWLFVVSTVRNVLQLSSIPILIRVLKIRFYVKPIFVGKAATAVPLFLIFLYFAKPVFPIPESLLFVLASLSVVLEIIVLARFLKRFYLIATGRHDTFD